MPDGYKERSTPTIEVQHHYPTSHEGAVDLMGLLPSGEHLLVLVDYYSR